MIIKTNYSSLKWPDEAHPDLNWTQNGQTWGDGKIFQVRIKDLDTGNYLYNSGENSQLFQETVTLYDRESFPAQYTEIISSSGNNIYKNYSGSLYPTQTTFELRGMNMTNPNSPQTFTASLEVDDIPSADGLTNVLPHSNTGANYSSNFPSGVNLTDLTGEPGSYYRFYNLSYSSGGNIPVGEVIEIVNPDDENDVIGEAEFKAGSYTFLDLYSSGLVGNVDSWSSADWRVKNGSVSGTSGTFKDFTNESYIFYLDGELKYTVDDLSLIHI